MSWAEKVLTQESTNLKQTRPDAFVKAVEARVRRDMDFIREVGNATECGIAITGTVVKTSFRNAVRDEEQGNTVTARSAQAAILSVFRSNLGNVAYKALDAFASNRNGTRPRSQSL
ncbi:hypothetical protein FAZ69_02760 [Trinickia terrae]|uniref:Uncharacterized protein n=1 Tax=Trinickia terrae TaxID=2571161 RepID=A0A4U1IFS5_9BURK|nr:hypothetical protein [Trinickia terrae]TKC92606.1 hypothetical protein FAZ69_02760 [Trinickia terrae]